MKYDLADAVRDIFGVKDTLVGSRSEQGITRFMINGKLVYGLNAWTSPRDLDFFNREDTLGIVYCVPIQRKRKSPTENKISETKYKRFIHDFYEQTIDIPFNQKLTFQVGYNLFGFIFNDDQFVKELDDKIKATVIIPAYNEEKTLQPIVECALNHPLVDEVICINDGSKDGTHEIVSAISHDKLNYINIQPNQGKGHAVSQGVKASTGDIIVMVDADLIGLSQYHITHLIMPFYLSNLDMQAVLGIRRAPPKTSLQYTLTGERAYYRDDFMRLVPEIEKTRFGIETILNENIDKKRTVRVNLFGFKHLLKYHKEELSTKELVSEYAKEIWEVAVTRVKHSSGFRR